MPAFIHDSDKLPDAMFKTFLQTLLDNAKPQSGLPCHNDAMLIIMQSSRAMAIYPEAPEILLDKGLFDQDKLFGRQDLKTKLYYSYMCNAIILGLPRVVELLLRHEVIVNTQIGQFFHDDPCSHDSNDGCSEYYTWLTLAVEHGTASCAEVLIQHGADVVALDGARRSAISLASFHKANSHPRFNVIWEDPSEDSVSVTADQDEETLVVLRHAFDLRFQGRISMEDYIASQGERRTQQTMKFEESDATPKNLLEKILEIFLTPKQMNELRWRSWNLRKAWSLSFFNALVMRFFYILSYMILLALELNTFIRGEKRTSMPSRGILSTIAALLLALIWGSAQLGFSWSSMTTRKEKEA